MIAHPYLLAIPIAIAVGFVAAVLSGLTRHGQFEARAGLRALGVLPWQEFAHLVEDLLRDRGYVRADVDRKPGEGGFDLLMDRGSSRYLVDCKNDLTHRVTEQVVRKQGAVVDYWKADGAITANTGRAEPSAELLAANRRIEIIAGADLWRQIKPWTAHETRIEAEAFERRSRAQRLAASVAAGLLAGVLFASLAPAPRVPTATRPSGSTAIPAPAPPPAPAPADTPAAIVAPPTPEPLARMPDANLSEADFERRRASAAMEVRGLPAVRSATWSTRSTLVVVLQTPGAKIPDTLLDEACDFLLQFEELRFTRMQVESPAVEPDLPAVVRWRSCQ